MILAWASPFNETRPKYIICHFSERKIDVLLLNPFCENAHMIGRLFSTYTFLWTLFYRLIYNIRKYEFLCLFLGVGDLNNTNGIVTLDQII